MAPRMQRLKEDPARLNPKPKGTVAIDGGDQWSGVRLSSDEVREIASEAFSTTIRQPVLQQWFPRRFWLWRQWKGTIVRIVLPREVFGIMLTALLTALFFCMPGPLTGPRQAMLDPLRGVEKVWVLVSGLASFSLAFFLSQAYAMWRTVYVRTRMVQGRLNDLGLLCATAAERDEATGTYTADAEELLGTLARYVRVFNVLLYASLTRRFASLRTPQGLGILVERQELVADEREALLESALAHNGVMAWIASAIGSALRDGRLDRMYARTFQAKLTELRSTYAGIDDQLSGRLPLAYTHLMQLLVDVLVITAPLALLPYTSGAAWSTVLGAGLVTLFYSSVLNLAKVFLDPFDNDFNGVNTGIAINVATLLQETNVGSERWRRGASRLPLGALGRGAAQSAAARAAADAAARAFAAADAEARGSLGPAELHEALRQLGLDPGGETAAHELLGTYDADGSGGLDLDEFREVVAELRQAAMRRDAQLDREIQEAEAGAAGVQREVLSAVA